MHTPTWLDRELDDQLAALWTGVSPDIDGAALRDALADAVTGGKRFRPRLLAEVHDALGGRRPRAVVTAAAAVELLHTAFVVHDDLIDGDDLRRGRPSVPGRFYGAATADGTPPAKARPYAVAGAVLTGDLALSAALRAVAGVGVGPATLGRLLDLVGRALAVSAAGELADVRLSLGRHRPDGEEVLALAERKTAAYSFVLPMQLGAVLADAPSDVVDLVGEAGRHLGTAFQLYDDLAGMFGDPAATGKSCLADLREGKHTLLVGHARSTPHWFRIEPHWGDPEVDVDALHAVRTALEESGSRRHVERVAVRQLRTGHEYAAAAGIGPQALAWIAALPAVLEPEAA